MKNLLGLLFFFSFLFTHSQVRIGSYDGDSHAVVYNNGWGDGDSYIHIGNNAGVNANSTGTYFTNIGYAAGRYNSSMNFNVHLGYAAGNRGTTAIKNVAIGAYAMYADSGSYMTGDNSTSVGHESMYNISSGYNNSGLGYQSFYNLTTGYNNTALGYQSLYNLNNGYGNLAVGLQSGDNLISGTYNTFLGLGTDASSTSAINQTMIGYAADGQANNSVTLGNSDVTAVYMAEDSGATVYAAGLNLGSTAVTSTAAELNYVDGVTSNVQTQLDAKQATITGAASTITSSNLTASRALTSNGSGKVEVSAVTSTELGYLDGVTSAVQTQIDAKQTTISASNRINANLINDGNISNTEFGYLNGLSSDIQTQLDAKNATINSGNRLDADLINDGSISNTEFNYLNGVTSAIQTQLDSKLSTTGTITVADGSNDFDIASHDGTNGLKLAGSLVTSTATELNLLDGVTTIGSGILSSATESSNTGVRLSTSNAANHGDIGSNAVDLSYSASSSSSYGATGDYSTAMGYGSTASGIRSFAGGLYTVASGGGSFAFHSGTIASGTNSTALGRVTVASDYASTVIGQYNSSGSSATSANSFSTSAPAFVIGNGADSSNKSDAFKVMFNGDATVSNDLTVSGDVVVSSDARLKSNIVSLGSTLSRLLLIDGKSYEMKGKQKIGVLAQEIKEVFPELVTEDANEMLAVNYQGLVPVLINALKEQQSEIDTYRDEVSELKDLVNQLISSK